MKCAACKLGNISENFLCMLQRNSIVIFTSKGPYKGQIKSQYRGLKTKNNSPFVEQYLWYSKKYQGEKWMAIEHPEGFILAKRKIELLLKTPNLTNWRVLLMYDRTDQQIHRNMWEKRAWGRGGEKKTKFHVIQREGREASGIDCIGIVCANSVNARARAMHRLFKARVSRNKSSQAVTLTSRFVVSICWYVLSLIGEGAELRGACSLLKFLLSSGWIEVAGFG